MYDVEELKRRLDEVDGHLSRAHEWANYKVDNDYPKEAIEPLNNLLEKVEAAMAAVWPVLDSLAPHEDAGVPIDIEIVL